MPSGAAATTSGLCGVGPPGRSATGWWALDYFTGGGTYMPRVECLVTPEGRPDWPWIAALLALTGGVIVAYLRIFAFWVRAYRAEEARDRNPRLMDLANIFLLCAVCGYAMSMVMFVWPGYRLLAAFLLVLNVFSWRFCADLGPFAKAFAAGRLERELREASESRAGELERLVAERTREAEEARAQADAASRAKSAFLANMSHELRTPMTAILGYADLLRDPTLAEADRAEMVSTIRRNGDHLLSIINDILDLSKIEAGKLDVERATVDTRSAAEEVRGLLAVRAEGQGLWLHLEVRGDAPERIETDAVRLRRILVNLVGNAVKFTTTGGVTLRVAGGAGGSSVRFEIADTGPGITPEQAARLFAPFVQGDASTARRFGGTGLGLSLSRRLARLLGGEIELASTPGAGSVFTLVLPVGTPSAGPSRPPSEPSARVSSPLRAGLRALLAEDGPDNQRLIEFHLRRAGVAVEVVADGARAVEAVQRAIAAGRPFDVVLMDMQMPEVDGYTATRRLRDAGVGVPVLALTANAMAGDRERCLAAGCTDYLAKPFDGAGLVRAVRDLLGRGVHAA